MKNKRQKLCGIEVIGFQERSKRNLKRYACDLNSYSSTIDLYH